MTKLRSLLKSSLVNCEWLRRPALRYTADKGLFPSLFCETDAGRLREILFLPQFENTTQLNQDVFALLVNRFQAGYFVEIGANDGVTLSNTAYLEARFGWTGLLVEANPRYTEALKKRKAKVAQLAITPNRGVYSFTDAGLFGGVCDTLDQGHQWQTRGADVIKVNGDRLEAVLREYNVPSLVDFISIDVEGGEVPIVEQLCSISNTRFRCGCVEHNGRQSDKVSIENSLRSAGYAIAWDGQTGHDIYFVDHRLIGL